MSKHPIKWLLVSGLGTGAMPIIPGTWASGLAVLFWLAGYGLLGGNLLWLNVLTIVGVVGATAACIAFAPLAIAALNDKDPRLVVADEFAGQWVAMIGITALVGAAPRLGLLLGIAFVQFVLFRVFDILKPWPCGRLERLPAGVGIAADDLMAGVYANVVGLALLSGYLHVWG